MTKLMQLLTADMGIATTPVGAYLDPSTALPLYLELARAHGCLHDAVRTPQLCFFFDANEMYGRRKCQVLSVHLPQARQPHQLLLQLPLARYLDQDDHITTSSQFERMDLLPALEKALESGWGGESMELVFSPDYAAYYRTTGTPPPTADCCCVECYGSKKLWKHPDWIRQPLRDFHNYPSRCAPFFRLMKCRLNSVYDVHHCNNHVLANGVIHPLWFWTRANLPEEYTVQLKTILEKHFTRFPYYPPFKEAIGKRDWSPPNIVTKDILKEDSFWKALADLFPRTANGLTVKRNGEVLQDPIHRYLKLMRILMVQLNSWSPEGVDQRDDMCREAHQLFWDLGFPLRRFGVPIHYFLEHYTPRLRKHGNLVGMSSEGGEHVHQPHSKIVQKRPSRPRGKCPVGLVEIMKHVRLWLGLWRQGWLSPTLWYTHEPKLPADN